MSTAQTQVFNERHELDIYLEMPAPYDENMLTFWNKNKQKLPKMATIAKIYYVYQQQAHLVSGLFPHLARLHLNERRARMNAETLEKLMFS